MTTSGARSLDETQTEFAAIGAARRSSGSWHVCSPPDATVHLVDKNLIGERGLTWGFALERAKRIAGVHP